MFKHLLFISLVSLSLIIFPGNLKATSDINTISLAVKIDEDRLVTSVPFQGYSYELDLKRTHVLSKDFRIQTDSKIEKLTPITSYHGFVNGTDIAASALLSNGTIRIKIFDRDQTITAIKNNNKQNGLFQINSENITTNPIHYHEGLKNPQPTFAQPKVANACGVKKATVSFDCSGDCYQFFNQDINALNQEVAEAINALNLIYIRDLRVELELGSILIRDNAATDPYASLSEGGDMLDALREDWNANDRGDFDMAALIDPDIGGGLAYVGTVCGSYKYSINGLGSSFIPILRHELGHNFGSNHFEGGSPEGETIMSGNSIPRFSGPEKDVIFQEMPSFTCLEDIGNHSSPVEPYAHFDDATVEQNQSQMINVLANDEDANCDTLSIDSVDPTSTLGNSLSISGSDILYDANTTNTGTDTFTYKVADGTGQIATGNVRVQVTAAPTPPPPPPEPETSSGGGAFTFWLCLLLIPFAYRRNKRAL